MGDDDDDDDQDNDDAHHTNNSSNSKSQEKPATSKPSSGPPVPPQLATFGKQLQGSWSQLKQLATSNQESKSAVSSATAADSFNKYKMQLIEKEKQERLLREKEEKSKQLSSSNSIENRPSPVNQDSNNAAGSVTSPPVSPPIVAADSTTLTSVVDSPQGTVMSNVDSPMQPGSVPAHSPQFSPPQNPFSPPAAPSSVAPAPASSDDSQQVKRTMSIQEMREKERRRRAEELAGKIDMNEQHKLIAQFEQNLK